MSDSVEVTREAADRPQQTTEAGTGAAEGAARMPRAAVRGIGFAEASAMLAPGPAGRPLQLARAAGGADRQGLGQLGYADAAALLAPPGPRGGAPTREAGSAVQRQGGGGAAGDVHALAAAGIGGASGPLPYRERIQASFGRHDVSGVKAHTGAEASAASQAMGAMGYATGDHVAFRGTPTLHTAAHEAAHVVQQRGGVALKGGVGAPGDAYEAHADAVADRVVAGQSAESLLDRYAGGGGGTPGVQLEATAVDVLSSTSSFAWSYLSSLMTRENLAKGTAQLIEQACMYLIDRTLNVFDLRSYATYIAPYLDVLRSLRAILNAIPRPILTTAMYGVGYAIEHFSRTYLRGFITEAHINLLLIEGGQYAAYLDGVIQILDDLANNPASVIYKGVWSLLGYLGLTSASSLTELLSGSASGGSDQGGGEGRDEAGSDEPGPLAPMIDRNLGFFWLQAQSPRIERWQGEDGKTERGGLVLQSRLGVKIFGNVMGSDNVQLRVPYRGDFDLSLADLSLVSGQIDLGGIFKAGPITAKAVRFTSEGLSHIHIVVRDMSFGDAVKATEVSARWNAGEGSLNFEGAGSVTAMSHTVDGDFSLQVGKDGSFVGGGLRVTSRESFDLVKDKLRLMNPSFSGSFGPGRGEVAVQGDLKATIAERLELASTALRLAYDRDKGFSGSVQLLSVDVPLSASTQLRFELHEARVDRDGIKANKVRVVWAYAPPREDGAGGGEQAPGEDGAPPQPETPPASQLQEQLPTLLPGFDPAWLRVGGLETLVLDASAADVAVGSGGLSVGALNARVAKFGARLFGVTADFDADEGKGSVHGQFGPVGKRFGVDVPIPVLPMVNAKVGLHAGFELSAGLRASAERARTPVSKGVTAWTLGGEADMAAKGHVEVGAGISVGNKLLAEVAAELFARMEANLGAAARVQGKVHFDENARKVTAGPGKNDAPRAAYELSATLTAAVGGRFKARAFYFFEKTLYEVKFKDWTLGEYKLAGTFEGAPGAEPTLSDPKQTFGGKDRPEGPPVEFQVVPSWKPLTVGEPIKRIDHMYRILHDLQDLDNDMSPEERERFRAKALELNQSGLDISEMEGHMGSFLEARRESGSLLMLHEEWLAYSTTLHSDNDLRRPTERKSVKDLDDLVRRYHEAQLHEERICILEHIAREAQAYLDQWSLGHSRKPMVMRLANQAVREKERLLKAHAARGESEGA